MGKKSQGESRHDTARHESTLDTARNDTTRMPIPTRHDTANTTRHEIEACSQRHGATRMAFQRIRSDPTRHDTDSCMTRIDTTRNDTNEMLTRHDTEDMLKSCLRHDTARHDAGPPCNMGLNLWSKWGPKRGQSGSNM